MTLRIAVLDDYHKVSRDLADWQTIADGEVTVFDRPLGDEGAVAAALGDFDVIVAMRERTPFPASLVERLPKLRLLVTTGMRNQAIDMAALQARGVPVCGTPMRPHAAAEHAWALILALFKRTSIEDRAMHSGGWQVEIGEDLAGKTIGILGFGKLGKQVARAGLAFDINVIAWGRSLTDDGAAELGARRVDRDDLFRQSDIVTVHLVLSPETRGIVGARELALMKPTAYLVNTSRGPNVDEAALIDALKRRAIAGAGLDVFDQEPLPADHPLRDLDNALLTGHTGYVTRDNFALCYASAVDNIRAWLDGAPVRVLNGV